MLYMKLSLVEGTRRFLQNVPNALERSRERTEVLRVADCLHGGYALDGVHQVIRPRRERGIDFVISESALLRQHESRAVPQEVENLFLNRLCHLDLRSVLCQCLCRSRDCR